MEKLEFYTYREFVDNAKTRKKHRNCTGNSSKTQGFGFTQTKSFEEAVSFAENGWDLGLEKYKIEDGVMTSGTTHLNPSLAGCIPHVQNHIMGFPQQMYDLYDEREYNLPTLDLVVNLNCSGGVNSEDMLSFGKSIVKYINYKASTHNIRLTGIFSLQWAKGTKVQVVTLKDFDESLVLNNIAFAFHPSFFRRIWFSVMEGKEYWRSGYGSNQAEYKKHSLGCLKGVKADNVIYFKSLMSLRKFDYEPEEIQDMIL